MENVSNVHCRITLSQEHHLQIVEKFIVHFQPQKLLSGSEVSKEGVEHMHMHIVYSIQPSQQAVQRFMNKNGIVGGQMYFHKKCDKAPRNSEMYTLKDCNPILIHNYSEEELEEIKGGIQAVQDNQKLDSRDKLFELCKAKHVGASPFSYLHQISLFIHNTYVFEYKKEPPLAHIKAYTLYIASKLGLVSEVENYYMNLMPHLVVPLK